MGYQDNVWAVERFQKARMLAIVVALGLLVLSIAFDMPWLHYPRGVVWALAGVASFYEGRAHKRLGRDPDAHTLRGIACVVIGVLCVL